MVQGIPNAPEVAPPVAPPATATGVAAAAAAALPVAAAPPPVLPTQAPVQPSAGIGPNAAPLNLFPQVFHIYPSLEFASFLTLNQLLKYIFQGMPGLGGAAPGALDFLRNNPQVRFARK